MLSFDYATDSTSIERFTEFEGFGGPFRGLNVIDFNLSLGISNNLSLLIECKVSLMSGRLRLCHCGRVGVKSMTPAPFCEARSIRTVWTGELSHCTPCNSARQSSPSPPCNQTGRTV